jgi:hypothetical protein
MPRVFPGGTMPALRHCLFVLLVLSVATAAQEKPKYPNFPTAARS